MYARPIARRSREGRRAICFVYSVLRPRNSLGFACTCTSDHHSGDQDIETRGSQHQEEIQLVALRWLSYLLA